MDNEKTIDIPVVGTLYWHRRKYSLPPLRIVSVDVDARKVVVHKTADFRVSRRGIGGSLILPSSDFSMSFDYLFRRYKPKSLRQA